MNIDNDLPWTLDPEYSGWVFAEEVYCSTTNNVRFYFIREPDDEPEWCAFVDGDKIVEVFAIVCSHVIKMATSSSIIICGSTTLLA